MRESEGEERIESELEDPAKCKERCVPSAVQFEKRDSNRSGALDSAPGRPSGACRAY